MPRQRLAPGEHGKITCSRRGGRHYATTYLRLLTGKRVEREASGKSAEEARRRLVARIAAELAVGPGRGSVNAKTTLDELFDVWIPAKVAEDRIGERTQTLYKDTWRLHGRKQLGEQT
ncbi:site-specific integrase, partial [Mycobacteroides abscessus subsp. abscessus]|nr:site-specific integrase [Mycobacteroides abscessus subsp. abscessus]